MKSLLRWFIKKFITRDAIKAAICSANKTLAETQVDDRKVKVLGWGEDASSTISVYLNAFADDGKIDPSELEEINRKTGAIVDKYIPDDRAIGKLIDAILA